MTTDNQPQDIPFRKQIAGMFGKQFFGAQWESIEADSHSTVSKEDIKWLWKVTDQILALLDLAKVRIEDNDQSFPEPDITINSFPERCNEVCHQMEQQNMFNKGWRRIKQPEPQERIEGD